jgi:hypothetical protein
MKEEINIDKERFDSLLKMLRSTDEDVVMAMSVLNNVDVKHNFTKIILLIRLSDLKEDVWKNYCRKVMSWLSANNLEKFSWQKMFDFILKKKAPAEDLQFFLDVFAESLFKSISNVGYEFLNNVEIKLKYKDGQK